MGSAHPLQSEASGNDIGPPDFFEKLHPRSSANYVEFGRVLRDRGPNRRFVTGGEGDDDMGVVLAHVDRDAG
jgi:hypothetical protein